MEKRLAAIEAKLDRILELLEARPTDDGILPDWLTTKEVASHLRCHRRSVETHREAGRFVYRVKNPDASKFHYLYETRSVLAFKNQGYTSETIQREASPQPYKPKELRL